MDIHSLDGALQAYFAAGIADSTHKTYGTAERRFVKFCKDFSLSPYPVNENILCYFVACLGQQGLTAATIKTYLSGVRQMQIAGGYPDPNIHQLPRLRQVIRGVELMRGRRGLTKRPRLPITPSILKKMRGIWVQEVAPPTFDQRMLWAASLTAFFGFCRSGEVTIGNGSTYDADVHLSIRDVAVDCKAAPTMISLLLRRTKTDQARKGVKIVLGKTGRELCPVKALLDFLEVRGMDSGPLFRLSDGQPLTRPRFVEEVRRALLKANLPARDFAGHSFRIGAATTASAAGVEDSTIQALGRWKSSAFLKYIRASPKHLAGVAKTLSSSNI